MEYLSESVVLKFFFGFSLIPLRVFTFFVLG
jgi:hypothetical protein